MNQTDYDKKFGFVEHRDVPASERVKEVRKAVLPDCSFRGLRSALHRRLPLTRWIRSYEWRSWLFRDVVAGATMGIYNIPQSMAYSVLASLPPVYGLYASFFPPLMYFIFGSSFHSSIGVFSLTSLMTGQARERLMPDDGNGTTSGYVDGLGPYEPIDIVVVLTLTVGIVQLLMTAFRLDFLTSYLSDPLVSAFNLGSACHALVSQIPALLGVKTPSRPSQIFVLFEEFMDCIVAIPHANVTTVTISTVCIILLVAAKIVSQNVRWLKLFPAELVLMILVTIISEVFDLQGHFDIETVGEISTGMPSPKVPDVRLVPKLIPDAISIAIVAFAITISMGKLFAKKYKYEVDSNQELLALGLVGTLSSFFEVFPCSTSLSRTLVNESAGAKTQISGLVSSFIILLVILWIGPFLYALPTCLLAAIVVVALRSLFMKITELPYLWRFSKTDFWVWIVTAVAVIVTDLIPGLVVGVLFALITVILRTQFAHTRHIVEVEPGDFRDIRHFPGGRIPSVPVIRFDAPPIFTNCELLKKAVYREAEVILNSDGLEEESAEKIDMEAMAEDKRKWKCLVLDCCTWTYTDSMGVEMVRELHKEMCSRRLLLLFASVRSSVRLQYTQSGLYDVLSDAQFYPTLNDAIQAGERIRNESSFIPFPDLYLKLAKYIEQIP